MEWSATTTAGQASQALAEREGSWGGRADWASQAGGSRHCGVRGVWASGWVAEARHSRERARPLRQARCQSPLCVA